ncbi:MAG: hypothetical protein HYT97_00580 [Elusimicrobia bacterium]|nr:hypothetical protein [Elusimicrobiota bacterium]
MNNITFDLREIFKKRIKEMFFIFSGTIFLTMLWHLYSPRLYQSSVILKIGSAIQNFFNENSQTVIMLFNQEYFLKKIAQKLDVPQTDYKKIKAKIKLIDLNGLLRVDAFGETPEEAKKIAEVCATLLVERHEEMLGQELLRRTDYLRSQIVELNREIESLRARLKSLSSSGLSSQTQMMLLLEEKESRRAYHELALLGQEGELKTYRTRIEAPASYADRPLKPNFRISLFIGPLLGMLISFAWAFGRELLQLSGI